MSYAPAPRKPSRAQPAAAARFGRRSLANSTGSSRSSLAPARKGAGTAAHGGLARGRHARHRNPKQDKENQPPLERARLEINELADLDAAEQAIDAQFERRLGVRPGGRQDQRREPQQKPKRVRSKYSRNPSLPEFTPTADARGEVMRAHSASEVARERRTFGALSKQLAKRGGVAFEEAWHRSMLALDEADDNQRRCQSQPSLGRMNNGWPVKSERSKLFTMAPVSRQGSSRGTLGGGGRSSMMASRGTMSMSSRGDSGSAGGSGAAAHFFDEAEDGCYDGELAPGPEFATRAAADHTISSTSMRGSLPRIRRDLESL
eukprot:SAG22_NODE_1627_length_3953_cov_2.684565_2_plen_319_part_00